MEVKKSDKLTRREIMKALATIPVLGYFAFAFKNNITQKLNDVENTNDFLEVLGIKSLDAPKGKLLPATGTDSKTLRIGLVGNGWRGERLLYLLGFAHPDVIKKNTINGKYTKQFQDYLNQEDLNVEISGICDTFDVHTQRGVEISLNDIHQKGKGSIPKPAKIYPSYRDMIADDSIDAVIIATPDHMHALIAISAAKAGKHVYLEKPMTHSIEEAVALRDTIKSSGVVFQLGHENRQQMSFKIARELYRKGILGDVSMVHTYTNRSGLFGAWIRDHAFDHDLGNEKNINWKEFIGHAPWHDFDFKRYFSWQRYSDYGTSVTGNDFTHRYDCVNQILGLGIPESVNAMGGQYYYKDHGDMPDVFSAIFSYPGRELNLIYDATLTNGIYRQSRIIGSEATMDVDSAIFLYKDGQSQRYKNINIDPSDPMYYYAPSSDVDAVTSATSRQYMKGGWGSTFIDGKVIDASFLHLKEWIDAIRGQGMPSCNIDAGFEEAVTFNLANLAYQHGKPVKWDRIHEKAIIG